MVPDEETKNRIKHLALVGKVLFSSTSDNGYTTDFYIAKTALKDFQEGIDKLELDEASKKGMQDLIRYLGSRIDARLDSTNQD